VGPEKYPEKCGGSTKQICNCNNMSVRAALALFGMGSMESSGGFDFPLIR